jgi:hypothetical protein
MSLMSLKHYLLYTKSIRVVIFLSCYIIMFDGAFIWMFAWTMSSQWLLLEHVSKLMQNINLSRFGPVEYVDEFKTN